MEIIKSQEDWDRRAAREATLRKKPQKTEVKEYTLDKLTFRVGDMVRDPIHHDEWGKIEGITVQTGGEYLQAGEIQIIFRIFQRDADGTIFREFSRSELISTSRGVKFGWEHFSPQIDGIVEEIRDGI